MMDFEKNAEWLRNRIDKLVELHNEINAAEPNSYKRINVLNLVDSFRSDLRHLVEHSTDPLISSS